MLLFGAPPKKWIRFSPPVEPEMGLDGRAHAIPRGRQVRHGRKALNASCHGLTPGRDDQQFSLVGGVYTADGSQDS